MHSYDSTRVLKCSELTHCVPESFLLWCGGVSADGRSTYFHSQSNICRISGFHIVDLGDIANIYLPKWYLLTHALVCYRSFVSLVEYSYGSHPDRHGCVLGSLCGHQANTYFAGVKYTLPRESLQLPLLCVECSSSGKRRGWVEVCQCNSSCGATETPLHRSHDNFLHSQGVILPCRRCNNCCGVQDPSTWRCCYNTFKDVLYSTR